MRGRRGAVEITIDWVIAGLVTAAVAVVIYIMVASMTTRTVETSELESEIYLAKLYYSPHMMNSVDRTTQVTRTGVIDLQRLARLEQSNIGEDMAAKLTLYDTLGAVVAGPVYDQHQIFQRYEGFAAGNVGGAGGASLTEHRMPVLYEQNGLKNGVLKIEIVRLNG